MHVLLKEIHMNDPVTLTRTSRNGPLQFGKRIIVPSSQGVGLFVNRNSLHDQFLLRFDNIISLGGFVTEI